ncbi:MAG: hypothetical protein CMA12_07450 [Euryarchaeota archaeon]|nr:hypothetical protein [Euryarchaeota archaeon]|tara:strand:- start:992 stop:1630 length:639 start_codon:yes stop_codon:yes gene_type:complete
MTIGEGEDIVFTECPSCSEETEHKIIKKTKKGKGEDFLVRCIACAFVHKIMLRPPDLVLVKTTLSDGNNSQRADLEVDGDEVISVGDVFEHLDATWRVTRLDNSTSQPEQSLVSTDIFSMWATRTDKVVIGITLTDGEISDSIKMDCEPERKFSCGTIMVIDDKRWRIRAIHTGKGRTLTGSRFAREIRRIYAHNPNRARDELSSVSPRKKK